MSASDPMNKTNDIVNNFNGGSPATKDLVPAIVFSALLALSVPLLAWRLFSKKHRTRILINSLMFFLTRLASLILRAYMAKKSYSEATLIAELILVSIGYLFLINALIDLWQRHVESTNDDQGDGFGWNHKETKVKWVKYFAWFLRTLLLASAITAIVAGALLRKSLTSSQKTTVIRDLIKASYVLSLATTVITIITKFITHAIHHQSIGKTALLSAYSIPLLIVGIYRVVEVFTGKYRATTRQIAAFWVAMILFEVIAYSMLLAVSIPKWLKRHHNRKQPSDAEKKAFPHTSAFSGRHPSDSTVA